MASVGTCCGNVNPGITTELDGIEIAVFLVGDPEDFNNRKKELLKQFFAQDWMKEVSEWRICTKSSSIQEWKIKVS